MTLASHDAYLHSLSNWLFTHALLHSHGAAIVAREATGDMLGWLCYHLHHQSVITPCHHAYWTVLSVMLYEGISQFLLLIAVFQVAFLHSCAEAVKQMSSCKLACPTEWPA
jgi:hypothetical protein